MGCSLVGLKGELQTLVHTGSSKNAKRPGDLVGCLNDQNLRLVLKRSSGIRLYLIGSLTHRDHWNPIGCEPFLVILGQSHHKHSFEHYSSPEKSASGILTK